MIDIAVPDRQRRYQRKKLCRILLAEAAGLVPSRYSRLSSMVSSSVTVSRVVEFVDVGRGSRFVENIPSFVYIRLAKSTKKAK